MKNKTVAVWLAFLGGPLGLHRFYLYGLGDTLGWLLPVPTALGLYGVERLRQLGVDDQLSWLLIPLLGFTIAACALTAIVYGLTAPERWMGWFSGPNSTAPNTLAPAPTASQTNWLTVMGIAVALLVGTGVLMASLAFGFQHYFEYQIEEARKISQ